ncbi:MAG: hypothetical protein IJT37_00210 [Lachnospiraceae bacterium]|nr:hypothetical protein [Lachnospiraceae bacterium]
MNTVKMPEIIGLYKKCNLDSERNYPIRTEINTGTLSNKLNSGILFVESESQIICSGSTASERKVLV